MSKTITALVLVRDDRTQLTRCIESCREHVDKVLVVDAGSTDGSDKAAKELGAEVETVKWNDAYDKALNAGLKKVKTDWVLRIDSAEWFEKPPALRDTIAECDCDALIVTRREYYSETASGEQWHLRLWKNDPKMRYEGLINPTFPEDVLASKKVGRGDILISYDGYLHTGLKSKLEADLPLIEKEFERKPSLINHINLLEAQSASENAAATGELLKLAHAAVVDEGRFDPEPRLAWLVSIAIERLDNFEIATPKAIQFERYAKRWYSDSPMVLWALSSLAYRKGFRKQSMEHLIDLHEKVQSGDYSRASNVPSELIGPALWLRLASIAIELKQNEIALQNLIRLKEAGRADHSVDLAIARLQS